MRDHDHVVARLDELAPGRRDPVGQLGGAFAAGPVDVGLAVREPAGEVGRDARELIEGEALGDPEIGLAPAVVERDARRSRPRSRWPSRSPARDATGS